MMDSSHEWNPNSFFHRPEWRWLRAEHLHQTGRRLDRRLDDDHVVEARNLLAQRFRKRAQVAEIEAAYDVWSGSEVRRGELEARLLTDEPETDIAAKLGVPLPVLEAYHAVFFDVRSKKSATDWLRHIVIKHNSFRGFFGPMPFSAWKLAAFVGGTHWLNQTIPATLAKPLPAVLPTNLDLSSFTIMKAQRQVELWIKLVGAETHTKLQEFIRDYRPYRDWVAGMTGKPSNLSPSQLVCEEFLLRLDVGLNSNCLERFEAELPLGTAKLPSLKTMLNGAENVSHSTATVGGQRQAA
jgi:hypothetical protein